MTTSRPWKARREEIEKYKAEPWATVIRDCLREIDRRGELIGLLQETLKSLRNEAAGFLSQAAVGDHGITNIRCLKTRITEADTLLREADEVTRG